MFEGDSLSPGHDTESLGLLLLNQLKDGPCGWDPYTCPSSCPRLGNDAPKAVALA